MVCCSLSKEMPKVLLRWKKAYDIEGMERFEGSPAIKEIRSRVTCDSLEVHIAIVIRYHRGMWIFTDGRDRDGATVLDTAGHGGRLVLYTHAFTRTHSCHPASTLTHTSHATGGIRHHELP